MVSQDIINDFVDETVKLLDSMSVACRKIRDPAAFRGAFATIERCLHTIKGNAGTFGFDVFSDAASRVLNKFRGSSKNQRNCEREHVPIINEFIARARQYIDKRLPNESNFFAGIPPATATGGAKSSPDTRSETAKSHLESDPSNGDSRSPSEAAWKSEIDSLLAAAPKVHPQVDALVRLASEELASPQRTEGTADSDSAFEVESSVELSPLAGNDRSCPGSYTEANAGSSGAPAVHGFVTELRASLAEGLFNSSQLPRSLSEVLTTLQRWSLDVRSQSIRQYVSSSLRLAEKVAAERGATCRIDLVNGDSRVHPGTGLLAKAALTEVFDLFITSKTDSATPMEVSINVENETTELRLMVQGISGLTCPRSSLDIYLLHQKIAPSGVAVNQVSESKQGSTVCVTIPRKVDSLDALIARSGQSAIALPFHRVVSVRQVDSTIGFREQHRGCAEIKGQTIPLSDLTESRSSADGSRPLGGHIIIVRTASGVHGLTVDEVERKATVAFLPGTEIDAPCMGCCVATQPFEIVPLLSCSSRFLTEAMTVLQGAH